MSESAFRSARSCSRSRRAFPHFKREWDAKLAEIHGEEWAQLFAEQLQNVLGELENGRTNALSDFMHCETIRVLAEVPVLMLPGVPLGDGGKSKK